MKVRIQMTDIERPNYYSILPASVRYCKKISDFGKLLFSEITALSNKYGYCTASNMYFAKLYDKDKSTIQRQITNLKKAGFLKIEHEYDGKQIKSRRVYPVMDTEKSADNNRPTLKSEDTPSSSDAPTPIGKNAHTPMLKSEHYPIGKNEQDNITSINTTSINKEIVRKPDVPYKKIIDYLNEKTKRKYRASSQKARKAIKARWNEDYTLDQFKKVIDNKIISWGNDSRMCNYLRPETLFGPRFDDYLNEKLVTGRQQLSYENDESHSDERLDGIF